MLQGESKGVSLCLDAGLNNCRSLSAMRWKTTILFAVVALCLAIVFAWPQISFHMFTGRFFPIAKIETLKSSVGVKRWSPDGLILEDGRTIPVSGIRALPTESAALKEVTKRGVEFGADGHVYGLVRVHHWCGNDPVREHIARVDISDMLTYLRVGMPVEPVAENKFLVTEQGGTFSEWGWRIGEFLDFQMWQNMKNLTP